MKVGTLYGIVGSDDKIYYGQVRSETEIGFFRIRSDQPLDLGSILNSPSMMHLDVATPSITRALRSGRWKRLGAAELAPALRDGSPKVHWPVGATTVMVQNPDGSEYESAIDNPAIDEFEIWAIWDAERHVPNRLVAEYNAEPSESPWGGPMREERIRRERQS